MVDPTERLSSLFDSAQHDPMVVRGIGSSVLIDPEVASFMSDLDRPDAGI